MIISDKYKLIFISIPKTGTSSMQEALLCNLESKKNQLYINERLIKTNDHITATKLKDLLAGDWNTYYKFAVVRDPYERRASLYRYYRYLLLKRHPRVKGMRLLDLRLRWLLAQLPFVIWAIFYPSKSCTKFVCDKTGTCIVDKVIYYQNLEEELKQLIKDLDLPNFQLARTNQVSNNKKKKFFLETFSFLITKIYYRKDYNRFFN